MNGGWRIGCRPTTSASASPAWAFYDGIYDYGSAQFTTQQKQHQRARSTTDVPRDEPAAPDGWYARGARTSSCRRPPTSATTFSQVFPGFSEYGAAQHLRHQARVNELYLSYSKGPFFLRFGKQSISWGESDTIALLDQSNPFDITLAAPGFFEDIDEARIPLYTLRTSYNVFDVLGPLSSGFVEGYWVPGFIDATTATCRSSPARAPTRRAASTRNCRAGLPGGVFPPTFQFLYFDHTLPQDITSSRWGIRFQSVVNRFLTLQTWVYRTYPQGPGAGEDRFRRIPRASR